MLELARDERLAHLRQEVRVVGVVERVLARAEQRLMRVHARAVLAVQGLRHEGRMPAVLHRELLHRDAVRHAVVGHLQCVRVAHVDLVLGRTHLVVGVLHVDPQLLQRQHRLAAHVRARVQGRQVEVAAPVEHLGGARVAEQEVLELRAHVEGVEAHVVGPPHRPAQHMSRVALVRRPLGRDHVAEHPRHALLLRAPRQHRERARVGHRDHVRLLDRVEARDRRAVEAHARLERVVQLVSVDREGLQLAQDVREPKADEADVASWTSAFTSSAVFGSSGIDAGPYWWPARAAIDDWPNRSLASRADRTPAIGQWPATAATNLATSSASLPW